VPRELKPCAAALHDSAYHDNHGSADHDKVHG